VTKEPDNLLTWRDHSMQQIKITLWLNNETRDWSVEIDGQYHPHVTSDVVEALVECELIVAETSLINQLGRHANSSPVSL
jgi:hypothetical protein